MDRKIKKRRYLMAFVITSVVFLLGIILGLMVENKRISYASEGTKIQNADLASLQMQYNLIDQLSGEGNCKAVEASFSSSVKNLEETRSRLENYNQQSSALSKSEFELLKREYTIAQIQYWLLAKRSENVCNRDIVTVLYFYGNNKDCPQCENQGFILTYLKKIFQDNLLIFSFDGNFNQEPTIDLLKKIYRVNTYPTLVINDQAYNYTNTDDLMKIVCNDFKNNSNCPSYNQTNSTFNSSANITANTALNSTANLTGGLSANSSKNGT